ncbi:MAG: DUF2789 domain-containing protein [Pseudomonas sp.]|uniref:DUF2789 domain-containing protein n=1 Tax=Pseudomonas sp. TaxID=306 RepID=UPI00271BD8FA|nr:DUF2789 domain-containing protein [Pseudomonas sp.]MDO9616551.1 DUF2789 domain-containing protein [Pseudomonas sp.]MDP2446774.1 DUF2789 domain-containing protein [Pseudomonas sp.]MDZ4334137.1 DUF2789 domain-containing protein [Pseudomonas sp.]
MQANVQELETLFQQLGLEHDQESIDRFIKQHSPLPEDCRLADAPFWDKAQADFLRQQFLADAEWAEVVDQLNLLLRG